MIKIIGVKKIQNILYADIIADKDKITVSQNFTCYVHNVKLAVCFMRIIYVLCNTNKELYVRDYIVEKNREIL